MELTKLSFNSWLENGMEMVNRKLEWVMVYEKIGIGKSKMVLCWIGWSVIGNLECYFVYSKVISGFILFSNDLN